MKTINFKSIATLAIFSFLLSSCGGTSETVYDDMFNDVETENYEIMALASMDENLTTFVELVNQSDIDFQLEFADEPLTVLIPTNEAFDEMPLERFEELTAPGNKALLRTFVMRHILPTEVPVMEFNDTQIIETAAEEEITISTNMGGNVVTVGGATIVKSDIPAANGLIHIVNNVIEPTSDVVP